MHITSISEFLKFHNKLYVQYLPMQYRVPVNLNCYFKLFKAIVACLCTLYGSKGTCPMSLPCLLQHAGFEVEGFHLQVLWLHTLSPILCISNQGTYLPMLK